MIAALIVAAGRSSRMGAQGDKLMAQVAGRPLIVHTWARFEAHPEIDELVLVVRGGSEEEYLQLQQTWGFTKPVRFVPGGRERQDSVWNGLEALSSECQCVAIQDGARPCTPAALISETISAAREHGAAVAAEPLVDTIKESSDGLFISRSVDRSRLWAVQTPQVFRVDVIRKAIATARSSGVVLTDDTAACERIQHPVRLVRSQWPNPKATSPPDLAWIEFLLRTSRQSLANPPSPH